MTTTSINVIGAGLAGSEAAWQIAKRGLKVRLYEMRPEKRPQPTIHKILLNWSALIRCVQIN